MSLNPEQETDLKNLLITVHNQTDWKRISGYKNNKWDVFTHAIKAAGNQETIPKFLDRLCDNLSIQSIQVSTKLLQHLRGNQRLVLEAVRKETQFWVALVANEVQN
jgi:uncharacterized protein YerC